jgi:hypothetical protein
MEKRLTELERKLEEMQTFMEETLTRLGSLEDWRRGLLIRNAAAGHTPTLMHGFRTDIRNRVESQFDKNVISVLRGNPELSYSNAKKRVKTLKNRLPRTKLSTIPE